MRVLVTYGWCRTAYVISESLARAGFTVCACGDSALSMTRASRYVDSFDLVPDPFGDPRAYAAAVGDIMQRRCVCFVMPAHEDFAALQQFRSLLPSKAIIAAPSYGDAGEVLDKWKLIQRAKRANIPVPETYSPQSLEEAEQIMAQIPLPAIIKPHRGHGGKGVSLIHDPRQGIREYRRTVDQFRLSSPMFPLIQQYIKGGQLGSCFMAVDGNLRACFIEVYLRCKQAGFGTSVLRERAASEEIEEYTARLCRELKWSGVGHLDFIVSGQERRPYLLEMNPRFWGALNLAVRNGYDFPRALASWAATGTMDPRSFTARPPVSSLWIAGELMAGVDDLKHRRWGELLKSPVRLIRSRSYDDFRITDPLPFIVELAYYLTGFIRANGDVNPVSLGMINGSSESLYGPASR